MGGPHPGGPCRNPLSQPLSTAALPLLLMLLLLLLLLLLGSRREAERTEGAAVQMEAAEGRLAAAVL